MFEVPGGVLVIVCDHDAEGTGCLAVLHLQGIKDQQARACKMVTRATGQQVQCYQATRVSARR